MFRDLYKSANEDIVPDRAILDKAFLKAANPVRKKSAVLKYSYVGTAVAAVVIIGAVFANPTLFNEKIDEIKPIENEIVLPTQEIDNKVLTAVEEAHNQAVVDNSAKTEEIRTTKKTGSKGGGSAAIDNEPAVVKAENDVAVVQEYDDAAAVEGGITENGVSMFTLEGRVSDDVDNADENVQLSDETAIVEDAQEDDEEMLVEQEETIGVFSYMHDKSLYEASIQGEYKNTDISPVTNAHEAVERAKNECTVEYDTTEVFYDMPENMWKIWFYRMDTLGGDQTVYINSDGITKLIVYGK